MTTKSNIPNGAVASVARRPPVRVKLRRINADLAKPYPPDGETRAWWDRLKRALGTSSSAFVNSYAFESRCYARRAPAWNGSGQILDEGEIQRNRRSISVIARATSMNSFARLRTLVHISS